MDYFYMNVLSHFIADFFSRLVMELMSNKRHAPEVVIFYVMIAPEQQRKLVKKVKEKLVNANRKLISPS